MLINFIHSSWLRYLIKKKKNSLTWTKAKSQGPGNWGAWGGSTCEPTPASFTSPWAGLSPCSHLPTWWSRRRFPSCWYYSVCFMANCSPNDLSLERNEFTWLSPQSAPWVLAHRSSLSVCLPDPLPRISEPVPSLRARRVYQLRTEKDGALSNPPPGSQARIWALFVSFHGWNGLFGNPRTSFRELWVQVS